MRLSQNVAISHEEKTITSKNIFSEKVLDIKKTASEFISIQGNYVHIYCFEILNINHPTLNNKEQLPFKVSHYRTIAFEYVLNKISITNTDRVVVMDTFNAFLLGMNSSCIKYE